MARKQSRSLVYRRLKILTLLAVGLLGLFGVLIWIQDRPLREAEDELLKDNPDDAIQLIREWERNHTSNGRSQALLARSFSASGDYQTAIKIFEAVGAANAVEIHAWARAYLSVHQWSNALPLLTDLRQRDRENADVLHELAACQAKLGMLEEALATANEFRTHKEYAHRALLLIGVINTQRGNKTEAIAAWTQIEKFDPDFSDLQIPAEEFLTQFASLEIEIGEVSAGAKLVEKALSIRETAEGHFQAGLAADLSGDQADAKMHWNRALDLEPRHRNARESLARLALGAGNAHEAHLLLEPISSPDSARSSTTYLMQRVAQLEGNTDRVAFWKLRTEQLRKREAIDSAVNRLLTEDPNSYWSQVVRAYQFAEKGDFQQSRQILHLIKREQEDPFVVRLRNAIETRGQLPDKIDFPVNHF